METPRVGIGHGVGSEATQFKPGWKGGPGRPRASSESEPAPPATPLEDMQHVYTNPPSKDKTPGQKRCRQFLEEDFKGFVTLYMKLEDAHRAQVASDATSNPADPLPVGEKEQRVEVLIERLLTEWEEEDRGRADGS